MNELSNIAERRRRGHREGAHRDRVRPAHRLPVHLPRCGYGGSAFQDVRALEQTASRSAIRRRSCGPWGRERPPEVRALREAPLPLRGNLQARPSPSGARLQAQHRRHAEASSRVLIEALWGAGARSALRPSPGKRPTGSTATGQTCCSARVPRRHCSARTPWRGNRCGGLPSPDFARLKRELRDGVVFDGRNIYDPKTSPRPASPITASGGSRSRPDTSRSSSPIDGRKGARGTLSAMAISPAVTAADLSPGTSRWRPGSCRTGPSRHGLALRFLELQLAVIIVAHGAAAELALAMQIQCSSVACMT